MPRKVLIETSGLPVNAEAEKLVLGAVLVDDDSYKDVSPLITPADFSTEANRRIWATVVALKTGGERADRVTVANYLHEQGQLESVGGLTYITSLDDGLPQIYNLESYVRIIREKSSKRRLAHLAQKLLDHAISDDGTPTSEILSKWQEQADHLVRESGNRTGTTLAEYIDGYPGGIQTLLDAAGRERGLPTGFQALDAVTGGLYPGEMFTIGGRPGEGKTALATQLAWNIAEVSKKRVLFFSLEMTKQPIFDRFLAFRAGIPLKVILRGGLPQDSRNAIQTAATELHGSGIVLDDAHGINCAYMQRSISAHSQEAEIAAVFVDYIQLMSTDSAVRFHSSYERMTAIANEVMMLARRTRIPLVVLSQLRRMDKTVKDKAPSMDDLRDTGAIEQNSWVVALIHRKRDKTAGIPSDKTDLIIDKNRITGDTATIPLRFENGGFGEVA